MHRSPKPVRKCHGCGLNQTAQCGMFPDPHTMWQRHAVCPGYKNETLQAACDAAQTRHQADERKEKRRAIARQRRAVTHQNGDRHVVMAVTKR